MNQIGVVLFILNLIYSNAKQLIEVVFAGPSSSIQHRDCDIVSIPMATVPATHTCYI